MCVQALTDTFAGARRRVELRYPTIDGDIRLCSLTLTPLTDRDAILALRTDASTTKALIEDYAREKLFGPLGTEDVQWRRDPQGMSGGVICST